MLRVRRLKPYGVTSMPTNPDPRDPNERPNNPTNPNNPGEPRPDQTPPGQDRPQR
jgi:hypothetical protein